jgi:hypothetical protein
METSAKKFRAFIFVAVLVAMSGASANELDTVYISQTIPYENEETIASKIISKCTELGSDLSVSVEEYGKERGINILHTDEDLKRKTIYLDLKIASAESRGNTWTGHAKSATLTAHLFENGEKVGTTVVSKDSSGGFGAGFMGSCSVLGRVVNGLGREIVDWMKDLRQ